MDKRRTYAQTPDLCGGIADRNDEAELTQTQLITLTIEGPRPSTDNSIDTYGRLIFYHYWC